MVSRMRLILAQILAQTRQTSLRAIENATIARGLPAVTRTQSVIRDYVDPVRPSREKETSEREPRHAKINLDKFPR
jgi:hypothetical protein